MCDSSNEKQAEKLFLLWRHSALLARPFSWLAKNRPQGKPCRHEYARDWSVRYGALCRSKLLSPALRVSLLPPRIVEKATENEIYASGKFCLLSFSLSHRMSTLEKKNRVRSAQLIQAKVRKASVPSLLFLLWTSRLTCGSRTARWTRTAPVSRLWDRERSSGFQRWLARSSRHRWMLPPGLQSSHSWQWLIQKKKSSEPFPGILQCGAAFWPTTWRPCWMVATFVKSIRVTATF